jgi:HJR/Mrr/RecB family endonuclease
MLEYYIDILEQAIIENVRELEEPSREYTMSENKWMEGYTQALKDVLADLIEQKRTKNTQYSTLYKFNLN